MAASRNMGGIRTLANYDLAYITCSLSHEDVVATYLPTRHQSQILNKLHIKIYHTVKQVIAVGYHTESWGN